MTLRSIVATATVLGLWPGLTAAQGLAQTRRTLGLPCPSAQPDDAWCLPGEAVAGELRSVNPQVRKRLTVQLPEGARITRIDLAVRDTSNHTIRCRLVDLTRGEPVGPATCRPRSLGLAARSSGAGMYEAVVISRPFVSATFRNLDRYVQYAFLRVYYRVDQEDPPRQ